MRLRPLWERLGRRVGVAAVVLLVVAGAWLGPKVVAHVTMTHITAYFPTTTGLYPGDDVRVLGVRVGRIDAIRPGPDRVVVTMSLDHGVRVPADARAVTVAPSVVSARFVQLAPAYTGGPVLLNHAEIPVERTAVPMEWEDIKAALAKLAQALGPSATDPQGPFGRFVDTGAANLAGGNASAVRDTLRELSRVLGTLSDGRDDLFTTITNLQQFVDVLSRSNDQIVQFQGRLASVSSVLAGVAPSLGAGLDDLDAAVVDVHRFLDANSGNLSESVRRLADVTQLLADKRDDLERVLHSGPTALVNFYQIYKPAQGTLTGAVAGVNFANPFAFLCGAIEGIQANDSDRSAALCRQYLAPVLQSLMMNYPPLLVNPASGQGAFENQLTFSTPDLADRLHPTVTVPNSLAGLALPGVGP